MRRPRVTVRDSGFVMVIVTAKEQLEAAYGRLAVVQPNLGH